MQKSLIIGLIAAVLLVIFALQNAAPVSIKLWIWNFESSLALILLLTFAVGAIIGAIVSIPSISRKQKIIDQKKKIIEDLNTRIAKITDNQKDSSTGYPDFKE